ncbi:MAG: PHP domain-containing protein [Christensenellales bacterium]
MDEIRLCADYHMHTYYSDGKASVEDMVQAAIRKNMARIAITDHGSGHLLSGVHKWDKLCAELEAAQKKHSGIEILLGLEANLMSYEGDIDVSDKDLKKYDIIVMGLHKTAVTWKSVWQFYVNPRLSGAVKKKKLAGLTAKAYQKAMQRYPIGIIAHPGYAAAVDMEMLAGYARDNHCLIEINSRHNFMDDADLITMNNMATGFVVSSDAHLPAQVADFQNGLEIAARCGIGSERIANAYGGKLTVKGVHKQY